MVSASAVDAIYAALRAAGDTPTLTDIGLRSRVGKGACQGAFCAVRTVAHLYQQRRLRRRGAASPRSSTSSASAGAASARSCGASNSRRRS